ncbi:MAG: hypothetical protein EA377_13615 [Phycisphaerales bacterium]|nr:MAG: hypothetical protein EA377_13615 [Phycisphaerales bacterium]
MMRTSLLISATALWAILLMTAGCNIVGPVAAVVAGPGSIEAEYRLEDRPTVVFVDDRKNTMNPIALRRVIADRVTEELMRRNLVTQMISPTDAMNYAAAHDSAKNVIPVDVVGRAVGAEQVIFIEMLGFADQTAEQRSRGVASFQVRVIDVENRERLFPTSGNGEGNFGSSAPARFLNANTRDISPEMLQSRALRTQVREMLANEVGDRVAKLFYKHEARDLGGRLEPR